LDKIFVLKSYLTHYLIIDPVVRYLTRSILISPYLVVPELAGLLTDFPIGEGSVPKVLETIVIHILGYWFGNYFRGIVVLVVMLTAKAIAMSIIIDGNSIRRATLPARGVVDEVTLFVLVFCSHFVFSLLIHQRIFGLVSLWF